MPSPLRQRAGAVVAPFRGLHRNVRLILGAWLFANLGASVSTLFFNFYLLGLGFDKAFLGLFNAVPSFVLIPCAVPAGMFADRIGHRPAIRLGALLTILGYWGIVMSSTKAALLGWNAFSTLGLTLVFATAAPLLTANTAPSQRTAAFSLEAAVFSLTYLVGNLLGGPLPRLLGSFIGAAPDTVPALRMTLGLAAVLLSACLIPLLLLKPAPPHLDDPAHPHHPEPVAGAPAAPFVNLTTAETARLFFWLLLPNFIIAFGAGPVIPYLNLYLAAKFHLSFEGIGAVFAWSSLVTAAGVLAQPHLAARIGKIRAVVFVQAASIPFLLMLGFAPWFWVVAVAMGVRAALMNMGNPVYQSFCMDHVPVRRRANFTGWWQAAWSIGWGFGTWGSGWFQGALGTVPAFQWMFGAMTVLYIAAIALLWFLWGRERNSPPGGEVEGQGGASGV